MADGGEDPAPRVVRPTPTPIRVTDLMPNDSDIHSNSSPLGAALMQRKVQRQTDGTLQGNGLRPVDVQQCDSPGWEARLHQQQQARLTAGDPTQNNSSPLGHALLTRKMERQRERDGAGEQLDRQLPRSGDPSGPSELQRPPSLPSRS